jgi:hypothetical protein
MAKWILHVESRPNSADEADAYHHWYSDIHLPEIVAVGGFLSARRYEPADEGGAYLAIYEVETDDIEATRNLITDATRSGKTAKPVGVQMDPPPTVRYFREFKTYEP